MMKKLLVLAAIFLSCAPAYAQKTKAALTTEVNTNFAGGVPNQITAATVRSTLIDIVDSYFDLNGGTSLVCPSGQMVTGLPTLSSITCSSGGGGYITGPGTTVVPDIVTWNATNGSALGDSGVPIGALLTASQPYVGSTLPTPGFFNAQPTGSAPVWNRMGEVMNSSNAHCSTSVAEHAIIYDTNPQILTQYTSVFKMLFHYDAGSANDVGYAESPDGVAWTCYASNPIDTSHTMPRTFIKLGANSYVSYWVNGSSAIDQMTSTNGLSWSVAHASVVAPGGGWDSGGLVDPYVWINGGTYYMMYGAFVGGTGYETGLATSSNGYTFTKSVSNPVMANNAGCPFVFVDGSTYWQWTQYAAAGHTAGDIWRFTSSNLTSWSLSPSAGCVLCRLSWDEGPGPDTHTLGQVADPYLLEVNGKTYFYYDATNNNTNGTVTFTMKLAIANMTMANLVQTLEGSAPVLGDFSNIPPSSKYLNGVMGNPVVIGTTNQPGDALFGAAATISGSDYGLIGTNAYFNSSGSVVQGDASLGGGYIKWGASATAASNDFQMYVVNPSGTSEFALGSILNSGGTITETDVAGTMLCLNAAGVGSCSAQDIQAQGTVNGHPAFLFGDGTVNDGSGEPRAQLYNWAAETAAPTAQSGQGEMWDDSTSHQLEFSYNGGSNYSVQGVSGTRTAGDIPKFDAAGQLVDVGTAGVNCSGSPTSSFATVNGIVTHC